MDIVLKPILVRMRALGLSDSIRLECLRPHDEQDDLWLSLSGPPSLPCNSLSWNFTDVRDPLVRAVSPTDYDWKSVVLDELVWHCRRSL